MKNRNISNGMFVFVLQCAENLNNRKTSLVLLYLYNYEAGIRGNYHKSSDCFEYPQKSLI